MCQDLYTRSCRPAPTFTTTKAKLFLTVPSFQQREPVTLCVSKGKQFHRLFGTSETFYESHSLVLSSLFSSSAAVTHPLTFFSNLRFYLFFFKHCATSLPEIDLPVSSIVSRLLLGSTGN